MSNSWNKLSGTQLGTFGLGFTGTLLKSESGDLHTRNSTDTLYTSISARNVQLNNNSGTHITLAAPLSGSTASWTLTLPVTAGTFGQVLSTDGGGNTYWATVSGGGSGTGTVSYIGAVGSAGINVVGSPITSTGTLEFSLGDITPSSVTTTGTVTASNISGVNTGDQTITLDGDVTGSGTGTFTATLSATGVTAGTYGSAFAVPMISVDSKGRITAASPVDIIAIQSVIATAGTTATVVGLTATIGLTTATTTQLGGVRVGDGLLIDSSGTLSVVDAGVTQILAGANIAITSTGASGTGIVTVSSVPQPAVTSVGLDGGTTGLTVVNSPITSSGTLTLTGTLAVSSGGTGRNSFSSGFVISDGTDLSSTATISGTAISGDISGSAANVTGVVAIANGGTGAVNASDALINLGAYPASNPAGYTSNAGTVTSVGATGSVNGITLSGDVTTSGTITLGGALSGVDLGTQTTGTLAVSRGGTGRNSFSSGFVISDGTDLSSTATISGTAISGDISGSAANVTGVVAIANGGTGASTASQALINLGAYPASNPAGYTTNSGTVTSVGATGTINGITLSGAVTTSGTITLGGALSNIDLGTQTTGTLAVSRGGTGLSSITQGAVLFGGSTNTIVQSNDLSFNDDTNTLRVGTALLSGTASQIVLTTTASNASISIAPNGTGVINLGNSGTDVILTTPTPNATISIIPTGSGVVKIGSTGSDVVLTTPTTNGSITLAAAGNGSIKLGSTTTFITVSTASTVTASTTLTLGSLNGSLLLSLPNTSTQKIRVSGPNAADYAANLSANDLVNKQYVDGISGFNIPPQSGQSGKFLSTDGSTPSWSNAVASVSGTGTVNGITLSGNVTSSGNITLGGTLSNIDLDTQTTGTLAVSRGGTGRNSFSSGFVISDGTTLSSTATISGTAISGNISGSAANVTGVVAIANGGTGASTASQALINLGAYSASNPAGYTSNAGTVTSVGGTGSVNGITLSGTVTTSGNITLGGALSNIDLGTQTTGTLAVSRGGTGQTSFSSGYLRSNGTALSSTATISGSDISGNISGSAANVSGVVAIANGGTGATSASAALTALGAYAASNPAGYTSNAGTVTSVGITAGTGISVSGSPITTSGAITVTNAGVTSIVAGTGISISGATGAVTINSTGGGGSGTVTSVGGTGSVNGITLSGTVTSSGNLTLGGTLSGVSLTTQVTGTLPIANGGTGATSASAALTALGAYAASNPAGYTSNAGTVTSVGGTGSVNGITLSGSVTSSGNLTLGGTLSGVSLTTQVSGTLPIANGGTGATTAGDALTALGAYAASNPSGYITSSSVGNGSLSLGVSGVGLSGSASFSANQSGGATFTVTSNATSGGTTADTIVSRGIGGAIEVGAITANGTITATGDITAFSDARVKENVQTIENALELVGQLRGVRYTRRDSGTNGIGVIAQETQSVIPEVVHETDNGMLGVAYGNLVGLLIQSIKELHGTVQQLQEEIKELKSNANSND